MTLLKKATVWIVLLLLCNVLLGAYMYYQLTSDILVLKSESDTTYVNMCRLRSKVADLIAKVRALENSATRATGGLPAQ